MNFDSDKTPGAAPGEMVRELPPGNNSSVIRVDKTLANYGPAETGQKGNWSHKRITQLSPFNLAVAQVIPLEIDISGTALEMDGQSSGFIVIQMDSIKESGRTFMPGYWMTGNAFKKIFVTWPAQTNATAILNLWADKPGDEMRIG